MIWNKKRVSRNNEVSKHWVNYVSSQNVPYTLIGKSPQCILQILQHLVYYNIQILQHQIIKPAVIGKQKKPKKTRWIEVLELT